MRNCSEYEELVYLDVLGEIPPERRQDWENHISACAKCRVRKQNLEAILRYGKNQLGKASLSPFEAIMIKQRINGAISEKKPRFSLKRFALLRTKVVLSIAAAACLFLVSFIGLRQWEQRNSVGPVVAEKAGRARQSPVEEKEIIENLDLLEQMDTLRALVKVVDNKDIM